MTTIEIPNNQLVPAINFLRGLNLRPAPSRSRSKLVNVLDEARKNYAEDLNTLIENYQEKDADGEPVLQANGTAKIDQGRAKEFTDEADKLGEEVVTVDGGLHKRAITAMGDVLMGLDIELSKEDATVYDILMDAYDNLEDEEESETEHNESKED